MRIVSLQSSLRIPLTSRSTFSVRSTNVYEETSLGIYEREEETYGLDDSPDSRVEIWGKYLWKHARRQLSFDMWWLVLSLFLICIIEVSTAGT